MHTSKYEHSIFHHNGDYEGDVLVGEVMDGRVVGELVRIQFDDILELVGDYYRQQMIDDLESRTGRQILEGDH